MSRATKGNGLHRDPEQIEREVTVLREDCARLLHELEHRYQRIVSVPGRIKERSLGAERAVVVFAREHRVGLAAGLTLVGATAALLYGIRRGRRTPAQRVAIALRRRFRRLRRRAERAF